MYQGTRSTARQIDEWMDGWLAASWQASICYTWWNLTKTTTTTTFTKTKHDGHCQRFAQTAYQYQQHISRQTGIMTIQWIRLHSFMMNIAYLNTWYSHICCCFENVCTKHRYTVHSTQIHQLRVLMWRRKNFKADDLGRPYFISVSSVEKSVCFDQLLLWA